MGASTKSTGLTVGGTYCILMHADEALAIPLIQTLIYSGSRTRSDGVVEFGFRELKPHDADGTFSVLATDADDLLLSRAELIHELQKLG